MEKFKPLFNNEPKEPRVLFNNNNFGSKRDSKKINKEIFILKLKMFFLSIQRFPALLLKFFRKSLFGLLKLWGSVLLIITLFFLYVTEGYSMLYYKISVGFEKSKIERIKFNIIKEKKQLYESEKNITCYKNQLTRIVDDEIIDLKYCKWSK